MRIDKIVKEIKAEGFPCKARMSRAGPIVGVKVLGQDKTIWALVPIDKSSDDRFVKFLISEAQKERGEDE